MNKKIYFKKNRLLQRLKYNSRTGNKLNYFYYVPNNSKEHENVKFEIFKKLRDQGYNIFTEAQFNDGCKADLIIFDKNYNGYIIEVLHTETEERFNLKKEKYPQEFKLIKVYTKNFNKDKWEL